MNISRLLRKFHRWVGLFASIWLLLLALTGFLLQHSPQWQLDKKFINNSAILKLYGIGEQFIAFVQENNQLIQLDKQLIQNNRITVKLNENIRSAIYQHNNWIVATATQILWLDNNGQIIKGLDELDGLTMPIDKIGQYQQELVYQNQDKIYTLDSEQLQLANNSVSWQPVITNDNKLKQLAIVLASSNYLSVEKFVFDIHAGITTSIWLNDIAAIALIILSLSGIFLFFRKNKRKRQSPTK